MKNDGTVWAWGYNAGGLLGDGTTIDRFTPVQVRDLSNAQDVSAGGYHNLAADAIPPALPGENGKIAFQSNWNPPDNTNPEGDFEIFTMNPDGSGIKQLTRNGASDSNPGFSPDGKSIVFTTDRDGNAEIYTMGADGSNQINRTNNPAWDSYPNYSYDGKQIAFHSNRDDNFDVYKMNSSGTGQTNLTNSPLTSESAPDFSPDGKTIAFESNRDIDGGPAEIYAMNATDGSGQTRLTNNPAVDGDPDWGQDGTAPALDVPTGITEVADDASGATVSFTATATDEVDGSVPVECSPESGSLSPIGTTTVTCSATDAAGNHAAGSFQVKVVYDFGNGSGGTFGEPVRDTELNRLAAGAGVPVKFGLGADYGLNIFAAGHPTSKRIDCDTKLPIDPVEETATVSKSGLTYDAASGLYTYVWKTDRAWKGTCRELDLKLADGGDHPVLFQFT